MWWLIPVISALEKQRQEDGSKFEAINGKCTVLTEDLCQVSITCTESEMHTVHLKSTFDPVFSHRESVFSLAEVGKMNFLARQQQQAFLQQCSLRF